MDDSEHYYLFSYSYTNRLVDSEKENWPNSATTVSLNDFNLRVGFHTV